MEFSNGQMGCEHECYYSGVGVYSQESEVIRYVLVCDDCGEEMREITKESYRPEPVMNA